ncbi:HNH endonuclease [Pseudomonas frederiksbergensis]|uniref:HNH endonuclease n=1 Tax=Pseudomonas frederiksbergensis TaxID=104087 RepID=UPI000F47086D|nr:HNH endonuclease [Pseudomonas frederiksbergensis]
MKIWRLIAHHEDPDDTIEKMKIRNRVAIGWSNIGDLRNLDIRNASNITSLIKETHHEVNNAHLGGPSLWNLYKEIGIGDLAIVNANNKKICVFEIIGPYMFEDGAQQINGYAHQRPACLTDLNPNDLWNSSGSKQKKGQNSRWTLFQCNTSDCAKQAIFEEGLRYSVTSTVIERNPLARKKCIEHFGCKCFVCEFDFYKIYGELGKNYIHVHHRIDISTRPTAYEIHPIKDLVPLCPNCHAMVHKIHPSISVENLSTIYRLNSPNKN